MTISPADDREATGDTSESVLSAVDKAMMVLNALVEGCGSQSLTELTRRTGLAKSTVHRLLGAMVAHKTVERVNDRYFPGEHLADRAQAADPDLVTVLRRESTPFLVELYQATGATAVVSVLAPGGVCHVNQVYGHRSPRLPDWWPTHPVHAGNAISSILAAYDGDPRHGIAFGSFEGELTEVRRTGIAHSVEPGCGITSLAVSVRSGGAFRSSISLAVSGRTGQLDVLSAAKTLRRGAFELARAVVFAETTESFGQAHRFRGLREA
jgi:IclR family acetate operon transcriptional repressor